MTKNLNISSQIILLLILFFIYIACNQEKRISNHINNDLDSTDYFIDKTKEVGLSSSDKLFYLKEAYRVNALKHNDTLKNRNLLILSYEGKKLTDTSFFKKVNQEAYVLSQQLKDTFSLAYTLLNLGAFYYSKEAWVPSYKNYYQAYVNFEAIDNDSFSGNMLFNMANVQCELKDFTGSEITTFKAIEKFTHLKKPMSLYRCYNQLGIISRGLNEYGEALNYNNKALGYLANLNDTELFEVASYNNIGLVYQDLGNYEEAIIYFEKALDKDNLKNRVRSLYPKLLDNLTYNRFLNGETLGIENDFLKALHLRDSANNVSGIIMSKLHLAEYYAHNGDSVRAIDLAKQSLQLSTSVNNNRDWLKSLKFLATLDKKNAANYLSDYVKLNDSLQQQERIIRNKFTRIRFETDEYIETTQRLTLQNILISIIGGILVLVFSLLYFIKRQRAKNKELLLEGEQQKANEEIYSLMLKQQSKLEEGQLQERHRISEELHDGVLGKLFGTRVGLGYLPVTGNDTVREFKAYIKELQHIEKEIRDISHELKNDFLTSKTTFESVVEQYVTHQSKLNGFRCTISADAEISWDGIEDKTKVTLYRIIQEAIQNIIKHANANMVIINFYLKKEMLNLVIKDNGLGFDTNKKNKGIGLKNMYSRISKLNGSIFIDSVVGHGTTLTITVPI